MLKVKLTSRRALWAPEVAEMATGKIYDVNMSNNKDWATVTIKHE